MTNIRSIITEALATSLAIVSGVNYEYAIRLDVELDPSQHYRTVKRVQPLHTDKKFDWRTKNKTVTEINLPARDAFDSKYGAVKAYQLDVWNKANSVNIEDAA